MVIETLKAEGVELLRYYDAISISGTNLTFGVIVGLACGDKGRAIEAEVIAQQLKDSAEDIAALGDKSESELLNEVDLLLQAERMQMEWRARYIAEAKKVVKMAQKIGVHSQLMKRLAVDEFDLYPR